MQTELWQIVWLSLEVSGIAVGISSIIGVPVGTWLGLAHFPGKRLVTALIYTGMAFPSVVVGLLIYLLLSRTGPLGFLGWLFTPRAMVLAQTILDLPFVIGITMTAVEAIPPELRIQVRSLGAGPWQSRWTVLREARSGIVLAVVTAIGRSMSEVGAVLIVGGNIEGHTRVMTTAIVLETSKGHFAFALVLGSTLLTIAMAVNLIVLRFQGRPLP